MLINIAHTSLAAYDSFSGKDLQRKEREVMALFASGTRMTREQIAIRLEWKEASVCGRVNSLVAKGYLSEIDGGKTIAGRSAKILRLPVAQLEMTL
jgi:predicted ArsR family transcriptional regulator